MPRSNKKRRAALVREALKKRMKIETCQADESQFSEIGHTYCCLICQQPLESAVALQDHLTSHSEPGSQISNQRFTDKFHYNEQKIIHIRNTSIPSQTDTEGTSINTKVSITNQIIDTTLNTSGYVSSEVLNKQAGESGRNTTSSTSCDAFSLALHSCVMCGMRFSVAEMLTKHQVYCYIKNQPSLGKSSEGEGDNGQPIFPSEEILVKGEPIEVSQNDETKPVLLENEQDPMPLNIPCLLPTREPLPSKERCNFCLTALDENVSLAANRTVMFRKKIEYVLSTSMKTLNMYCCPNCWRMFNLFYKFKKSCLMALSSPEQLLASITPSVEIVSEIKNPVYNAGVIIPPSGQLIHQQEPRDLMYHQGVHFMTHLEKNDTPDPLSALQDRPTQSAKVNSHILEPSNVEQPPNKENTQLDPDERKDTERPTQTAEVDANILEPSNVEQPVTKKNTQLDPGEREDADWWCKDTEETICSWCKRKCADREKLKRHRRYCYFRSKQTATIPRKCSFCFKIFHDRAEYQAHILQHKEAGTTGYLCRKEGCGKILGTLKSRFTHETNCMNLDKHVCNVCGAVFKYYSSLITHMANHGERRFACDKCDKAFYTAQNLKKHASVHSDVRNFECKVCGKRFKSSEANRVHQRIHTMEKPYACHICGEKFTYNCLLKVHMQKGHHPASDYCAG